MVFVTDSEFPDDPAIELLGEPEGWYFDITGGIDDPIGPFGTREEALIKAQLKLRGWSE